MNGICFDCGKEGKIHRHHLQYKPAKIIPLCPMCHRRRHSRFTAPWTEVLSDEQRDKLYSLMEEKEEKLSEIKEGILAKAYAEITTLSKPIEKKYEDKIDKLLNEYGLSDIPDEFSLATYPKPIWTLRFFRYLKPEQEADIKETACIL